MNRLEATRVLVAQLADEPVIASLGHPAYDLFVTGDRPSNFYTWGSMGAATSIGLGLALARPQQRVIVLDGDGSLLMNLGSLATIASCRPPNLLVVVWDNGQYGTTGGQAAATARGTDLAGMAKAAGIVEVRRVTTDDAFRAVLADSRRAPGPWVVVVRVDESRPAATPPRDCVFIKHRFMAALGVADQGTAGTGAGA